MKPMTPALKARMTCWIVVVTFVDLFLTLGYVYALDYNLHHL